MQYQEMDVMEVKQQQKTNIPLKRDEQLEHYQIVDQELCTTQQERKCEVWEVEGDNKSLTEGCGGMQKEVDGLIHSLAKKEIELVLLRIQMARKKGSYEQSLERELAETRKELEHSRKSVHQEKNQVDELKGRMEELVKERNENLDEIQLQKATIDCLNDQLGRRETGLGTSGVTQDAIEAERRLNERLQKELDDMKEESALTTIHARQIIEEKEREFKRQLEEMREKYEEQLDDIDGKQDLEEEVKKLQLLIQEMGEENATLREEVATLQWKEINQQVQFVVKQRASLKSEETSKSQTKSAKEMHQLKEDYDNIVSELSCKESKLLEMNELLENRTQLIATLKESLNDVNQTVLELKQQLQENMRTKQERIDQLEEALLLKETENDIYKEDFEKERKYREKIHDTLSVRLDRAIGQCGNLMKQLSQVQEQLAKEQEQSRLLREEISENEGQVEAKNASLMEVIENLRKEMETMKIQQEETKILRAQVDAYSWRVEELQKALAESEEIYKLLEKEQLVITSEATELTEKLKTEVESKQQLENELAVTREQLQKKELSFYQEAARATQLEQDVSKLKDQCEKMRNSNKTLVQKLEVYQRQSTPSSSADFSHPLSKTYSVPSSVHYRTETKTPNLSISPDVDLSENFTVKDIIERQKSVPVQMKHVVSNNRTDSIDAFEVPPLLNREEMTRLFRPNQNVEPKQREQKLQDVNDERLELNLQEQLELLEEDLQEQQKLQKRELQEQQELQRQELQEQQGKDLPEQQRLQEWESQKREQQKLQFPVGEQLQHVEWNGLEQQHVEQERLEQEREDQHVEQERFEQQLQQERVDQHVEQERLEQKLQHVEQEKLEQQLQQIEQERQRLKQETDDALNELDEMRRQHQHISNIEVQGKEQMILQRELEKSREESKHLKKKNREDSTEILTTTTPLTKSVTSVSLIIVEGNENIEDDEHMSLYTHEESSFLTVEDDMIEKISLNKNDSPSNDSATCNTTPASVEMNKKLIFNCMVEYPYTEM